MDKDYVVFNGEYRIIDEDGYKAKITYNAFTFKELLKGIIVKYTGKSKEEAMNIIENSKSFLSIETFEDASFFCSELDYHWAMLVSCGNEYWLNGFSEIPPSDYNEWIAEYIHKNNLKEYSFKFEKL